MAQSKFLANDKYSIAVLLHGLGLQDTKTWYWIKYLELSRWFVEIAERPAVIKGFKALNKDAEIDFP